MEQTGEARRAGLRTQAGAEASVRDVRKKIQDAFGPCPEKTPPHARVTGVLERDTSNVEKVIFESRPSFLVTANFFVPKGRPCPMTAIVGAGGHSAISKATPAYPSFAPGLARQGYVVLIFDPRGQGERAQYLTPEFARRGRMGTSLIDGNIHHLVGFALGQRSKGSQRPRRCENEK